MKFEPSMASNQYCGICGKAVDPNYQTHYRPTPLKTKKAFRHWIGCTYDHAKQIEEKE